MELRKLISKFLTSLVEKNYAQANDDLKKVVEEKVKQRVKASSDKLNRKKKLASNKSDCSGKAKCHCADCKDSLEESAKAKKPDKDGDGVPDYADENPGEDDNASKNKKGKKGKLSKEENKKRFLEMIAKKKKKSKNGNK
jgi:hypothetical protein